jgi:hypothetical protein
MQTFLPFPSFAESAAALNRPHLGNQRNETMVIMRALTTNHAGYASHPATLQWKGHELALMRYQEAIINEWVGIRGYKDTVLGKTRVFVDAYFDGASLEELAAANTDPLWLGNPAFHRSHQSNLVRKNPEYYGPLFPGVEDDLPNLYGVDGVVGLAASQR